LRAKRLEWVERSRLQLVREDVLPLCRPHRRAFAENANECQPGEVRSRACPSGCPPGAAKRVQARQRPGGKAPLDQWRVAWAVAGVALPGALEGVEGVVSKHGWALAPAELGPGDADDERMRFDADRLHATALGRQQDRAGSRERVEHPAPPRVALALDQVSRPLRREAGGVAEPAMDRERKIVDKCGVGGPLTTTTGHGSSRWEAPRPCLFPLVSWTPAQPPPSPRPRPSRAASRPCRPRPSSP